MGIHCAMCHAMVRTTICVLPYIAVYTLVLSSCTSIPTGHTSVDAVYIYIYTTVYALVYDTVCTKASTMADVITDANNHKTWHHIGQYIPCHMTKQNNMVQGGGNTNFDKHKHA